MPFHLWIQTVFFYSLHWHQETKLNHYVVRQSQVLSLHTPHCWAAFWQEDTSHPCIWRYISCCKGWITLRKELSWLPFLSPKQDCFLLGGINERVTWRKKTGILASKLATNHHWITTRSLSFPSAAAVDTGRQQLIVSTRFGKISQILCCSGGLVVRKKQGKKITFFINRDNEGKQDFFIFPLKALWNSPSVCLLG